jgi:hypothetical protein
MEIRKYFETYGSENTIYTNLWDAAQVELKGKNYGITVYIKNKRELKKQSNFMFEGATKRTK